MVTEVREVTAGSKEVTAGDSKEREEEQIGSSRKSLPRLLASCGEPEPTYCTILQPP
jgi:hypothetical protein